MQIRALTSRWVNAYLIETSGGCIVIDTGFRSQRATLEKALADVGCRPGHLRLILVTHGDADHAANAAFLREKYGGKIAMHRLETAAVEQGDMFLSRGPLRAARRLIKPLMGLFRLRREERFAPDVFLEDGGRLDAYGLAGTVFHVPGHTAGSIAVLTDDGDFFSGDFLENRRRPSIATFVDDRQALAASFERIRDQPIRTVYPGHGAPFSLEKVSRKS